LRKSNAGHYTEAHCEIRLEATNKEIDKGDWNSCLVDIKSDPWHCPVESRNLDSNSKCNTDIVLPFLEGSS
jgi:hypothetical protein